jgi:hypothetical protein
MSEFVMWDWVCVVGARGHVAWEPYCNFIPDNERNDFVTAYSKRLNTPDDSIQVIFGPS